MNFCKNWGSLCCDPQIRMVTAKKALIDHKYSSSEARKKEEEMCNKICKSCGHRLFLLMGLECSVCNQKLLEVKQKAIDQFVLAPQYFYICSQCKTTFYSYSELRKT
jgi:uncharacterized protein with PIN domain